MTMAILNVMTFNVRQMDGDDGRHSWEFRRDVLIDTIRRMQPDLIGTQELFMEQADYITAWLPEYRWFGRGRYGDTRDKHCGIFYRYSRFSLNATGEVWISETPEIPGSCSWGVEKPRMITWGELSSGGTAFFVVNTHFPYRADHDEARIQTVRLIRQLLEP